MRKTSINDEIEIARQNEYRRCDLIDSEFRTSPEFALKAIIAGWTLERARAEFYGASSSTKPPTGSLPA